MSTVIWTPLAESELDEVLFYIAFQDRRPKTGEKIYAEICHAISKQAAYPLMGHIHP